MIAQSLADIAALTGGRLFGVTDDAAAGLVVDGGVVTDSREAQPGSLYIARVGEHADGHIYVPAARDRGAVAALTSREVDDLPGVVVADVQAAFAAIAAEQVRLATSAPEPLTVIGITGSSGKTSTKDLLGQVLATAGETIAPVGSYNSEVGVPLTICRITESTRYLVVEMGARGPGHIDYLCAMAHPRIGAVLNVGVAHVGEFGSVEAIEAAKGELPANLPAAADGGVAVLNADDERVARMRARTSAAVVTTSALGRPDADVRAVGVVLDPAARASFTLVTADAHAPVRLGL
uniref:UDP-N-acetylmuramoyl-tripeptide--D-alanyl-D- alanine ligase n=1 Tax=Kribbia dieselivorans TaxID=331526 RepID=UPI000AB7B875